MACFTRRKPIKLVPIDGCCPNRIDKCAASALFNQAPPLTVRQLPILGRDRVFTFEMAGEGRVPTGIHPAY